MVFFTLRSMLKNPATTTGSGHRLLGLETNAEAEMVPLESRIKCFLLLRVDAH